MKKKDVLNIVRNFCYFATNFTQDFVKECWKDDLSLANHLQTKWEGICRKYKDKGFEYIPSGGIMDFFMLLSEGNQDKFIEWIDENYHGMQHFTMKVLKLKP